MKKLLQKRPFVVILTIVGAIGGFMYWKFIGCTSGTCPIQSVWYWSTLWGAAIGYLVGDIIQDFINKRREKTEKNANGEKV